MTDLQLLALSGFIFVGVPGLIFVIAFAIDRFHPGDQLAGKTNGATRRKHRPF